MRVEKKVMLGVIRILFLSAALLLAFNYHVEAHSLPTAAKTLLETAVNAADKTEPVIQTGGVRQTLAHTATDMVLEKGLAAVSAKYPAVKLASPMVMSLAKPALNAVHKRINSAWNGDESTTTPAPPAETATTAASTEATTASAAAEEEKKVGEKADGKKEEKTDEVKTKDEKKEEKKAAKKKEKSAKKLDKEDEVQE